MRFDDEMTLPLRGVNDEMTSSLQSWPARQRRRHFVMVKQRD